jgi:hypothetical protein
LEQANVVRTQSPFPADCFSLARRLLSKTVKNPQAKVHRMKRWSLPVTMAHLTNEALEKIMLKDRQAYNRDALVIAELVASPLERTARQERFFRDTELGRYLRRVSAADADDETMDFEAVLHESAELCRRAETYYSRLLDLPYKSALFNLLLRLPPEDRMTVRGFSVLMLPEYGGVSERGVLLMEQLCNVYHKRAMPREYRQCIDRFDVADFVVACYYFNAIAMLERISFVELDAETVRRTDEAMLYTRYRFPPGRAVPPEVYQVTVALCCERVCTQMGDGRYGNSHVAYDLRRQQYVCIHSISAKGKRSSSLPSSSSSSVPTATGEGQDDDEDNDDDDDNDDDNEQARALNAILDTQRQQEIDLGADRVLSFIASLATVHGALTAPDPTKRGTKHARTVQERKEIRNERRAFSKVPCGQTVIHIPLRGRALVWGNKLQSQQQIMFCPECGALHIITLLNFSQSETGRYRCNECARRELMHRRTLACAYCGKTSATWVKEHYQLTVLCPERDPCDLHFDPVRGDPEGVIQQLYFCQAHFRIARRYVYQRPGIPKHDLWMLIKYVQDLRIKQQAKGQYKKR